MLSENEFSRLDLLGWRGFEFFNNLKDICEDTISYPKNLFQNSNNIHPKSFDWWEETRLKIILEILRKYHVGLIWEIGAGAGTVSKYLIDHQVTTIAVEPHLDAIKILRNLGISSAHCYFEDLMLPSESINYVGLFDVIEHIENENVLLKAIELALSKTGKMFITVPAHKWLFSNWDNQIGHFRRYSAKSIVDVLDRNGFESIEVTYLFPSLVLPAILIRRCLRISTFQVHKEKNRIADRLLKRLIEIDWKIQKRLRLSFGTSILVVAQKKQLK